MYLPIYYTDVHNLCEILGSGRYTGVLHWRIRIRMMLAREYISKGIIDEIVIAMTSYNTWMAYCHTYINTSHGNFYTKYIIHDTHATEN